MSEIQQSEPASGIVGRAKAILVSPTAEWPVIAGETESVQSVFMRYVVPLAAIGPICGFIGGQVFGFNAIIVRFHPSLMSGIATAITSYVLGLVGIFLVAWVANFLADKFGGQPNYERASGCVPTPTPPAGLRACLTSSPRSGYSSCWRAFTASTCSISA